MRNDAFGAFGDLEYGLVDCSSVIVRRVGLACRGRERRVKLVEAGGAS